MEHLDHDTCAQVFERLDDYLDRELEADEVARVEKHLETCAICAAEFVFESALYTRIRHKLQRLDVPAGLAERVLAQLARAAPKT